MTRADLLTGSSCGGPEALGVEETVAAPPELDTVLPEPGPGASASHPKQFPISFSISRLGTHMNRRPLPNGHMRARARMRGNEAIIIIARRLGHKSCSFLGVYFLGLVLLLSYAISYY